VDEFSWAVGLFEGEGTVTRCGGRFRLALKMTDHDVVRRFAAAVGVGRVYGPYQPGQRKKDGGLRKPVLFWVAEGAEARLLGARMAAGLGDRRRSVVLFHVKTDARSALGLPAAD
jgi:hypothetical protein